MASSGGGRQVGPEVWDPGLGTCPSPCWPVRVRRACPSRCHCCRPSPSGLSYFSPKLQLWGLSWFPLPHPDPTQGSPLLSSQLWGSWAEVSDAGKMLGGPALVSSPTLLPLWLSSLAWGKSQAPGSAGDSPYPQGLCDRQVSREQLGPTEPRWGFLEETVLLPALPPVTVEAGQCRQGTRPCLHKATRPPLRPVPPTASRTQTPQG